MVDKIIRERVLQRNYDTKYEQSRGISTSFYSNMRKKLRLYVQRICRQVFFKIVRNSFNSDFLPKNKEIQPIMLKILFL